MAPAFELRDVRVRYGGVLAVDGVSLCVETGSIVGLIGPNGAGKTTVIDAVTGFAAYEGQVLLDDKLLNRQPAHARARAGLARTFQSLELFEDLTVAENLLASTGRRRFTLPGTRLSSGRNAESEAVAWAVHAFGLADVASMPAGQLSLGERKMVAIARAVVARPSVLLLDEPAAGLGTQDSAALGLKLRQLPAHGVSVLLVDHDMALVLTTCDYIYVISAGRIIAAGPPDVVRNNPAVIEAYLGGAVDEAGVVGGSMERGASAKDSGQAA